MKPRSGFTPPFRAGFTLIELLVVIAIIAVLAAIIAPNAFKAVEKSKISATIGDYGAVKTAAMSYYADTGAWPANGSTTVGLIATDGVAGWDGPYLETWPPFAKWGGAYTFQNDATQDWTGDATGDPARYLEITSVPQSVANALDRQLDGAGSTFASGSARYTTSGLIERLLVSADIAVNGP